jgi:hypothetical protein
MKGWKSSSIDTLEPTMSPSFLLRVALITAVKSRQISFWKALDLRCRQAFANST